MSSYVSPSLSSGTSRRGFFLLAAAALLAPAGAACAPDNAPTETRDAAAIDLNADAAAPPSCEAEPLYELGAALPSWMTASGDYLYWMEGGRTGVLNRMAKRGGVRERVAEGVTSHWASIASNDRYVFVPRTDGQIHRLTLDGREDVALSPSGGELVSAIQVLGPHVYWQSRTGGPGGYFEIRVHRASIDGTGATEVLWSSGPPRFSSGLAVGGGSLFVGVYNWLPQLQADGQILRLSGAVGGEAVLVTGLLVPSVHGADDRYVYYSAQNPDRHNELWRVAIGGGAAELVMPGNSEAWVDVGQMLIQGDTVWWGQANRGNSGLRLYRASGVGGGATPVVTMEASHMLGLAGDDRYLYFSTSYDADAVGPAAIWRIGRQCPAD